MRNSHWSVRRRARRAGRRLAVAGVRADVPHVYAITGARIVTAAGAALPSGIVVLRNGVIEAVGASMPVPADAVVIDGKGATVYPGLIDMGSSVGVTVPAIADPRPGAPAKRSIDGGAA